MGFLLVMAGWPLALDVGSIFDILPLHPERHLVKRTVREWAEPLDSGKEHVSGNIMCLVAGN